jgi:hypothetical protein
MAGRNSVLRGQTIELTANFRNAVEDFADPTNLRFSVYPPGKDPRQGAVNSDAWVLDATLTSGGSGSESNPSRFIEKISTGKYKYSFPVPAGAELGTAFDRWEGTIDGSDLDGTFTFVIAGGGSVDTTKLYENNVVIIELKSTIAATDGSTLGSDITKYFTTTYNPVYAGLRRVRLELGPLIEDVPDDTIMFAIFEASLSANAHSFQASRINDEYFEHAKREYTTCLAELTLVNALLGDPLLNTRMSKSLGDLSVSRGGSFNALKSKRLKLENCVAHWSVPLRTGGDVPGGASLRPGDSVKGALASDKITVNRQWEPTTTSVGIGMPAANTTEATENGRRRVRTYGRRSLYGEEDD